MGVEVSKNTRVNMNAGQNDSVLRFLRSLEPLVVE